MGLIYHAALEKGLIMCFMDSRNAPLPVFCWLVDDFYKSMNRDSPIYNCILNDPKLTE